MLGLFGPQSGWNSFENIYICSNPSEVNCYPIVEVKTIYKATITATKDNLTKNN